MPRAPRDRHGRRRTLQLPERAGLRPECERHACRQRRQPDRGAGLPRRRRGRLSRGRRIADDRRRRRFRAERHQRRGRRRAHRREDRHRRRRVRHPARRRWDPADWVHSYPAERVCGPDVGVHPPALRWALPARRAELPRGHARRGCTGTAKLTARRRVAGSRALSTLRLGRARLALRAGQRKTVKVRIPVSARRWLRSAHRRRGQATLAARNGIGQSHTNVTRVRIIRRR